MLDIGTIDPREPQEPPDACLYVVLSKSPTLPSQVIHFVTRNPYTHAALSLDSDLSYMFSFGRRKEWNPFFGCFKRESLEDNLYQNAPTLPGIILELAVTKQQYDSVCELVLRFLLNAHEYGYNYIGLPEHLLGIPHDHDKRFFCSEFVYFVLHQSGICDFGLPRGMIRPQNLLELNSRIVFEGDLKLYPNHQSHRTTRSVPFDLHKAFHATSGS